MRWGQGAVHDEVEFRLRYPEALDQWFCLTPFQEREADGAVWLVGSLRDISVMKRYQANADLFNSRKNATLEILSDDLSNAFIMVQQIAKFLREEVQAPANPEVTAMLRTLETTSRNSVKMIHDFIDLEFLTSASTSGGNWPNAKPRARWTNSRNSPGWPVSSSTAAGTACSSPPWTRPAG